MLKNKDTGDVLFVVVFTLLRKDDIDKEEVQSAEKLQQAASAGIEEGDREADLGPEKGGGGGDDDVD